MPCAIDPVAAAAWMAEGRLFLLPWIGAGLMLAMLVGPGTILVGRWVDERRWSRG